jgi:hypothetical protein
VHETRIEAQQTAEVEAGKADVPPDEPIAITVPSGRRRANDEAKSSPPTGSKTMSTCKPSGSSSYTYASSAPSARHVSTFSCDPTAATTRAPSDRAIWIVAVPTPPAAAYASTVAPGRTRTCRVNGMYAVRNVSRNAAPSANDAWSGSGTTSARSTAACSA